MIVRSVAQCAQFSRSKMAKASLASGNQLFAGLNCFLPGQVHELHAHAGQDKLYMVLDGCGDVTVGDRRDRVGPGDLVLAREGEPHALGNPGPENLVVLTVMAPPPAPRRRGKTGSGGA